MLIRRIQWYSVNITLVWQDGMGTPMYIHDERSWYGLAWVYYDRNVRVVWLGKVPKWSLGLIYERNGLYKYKLINCCNERTQYIKGMTNMEINDHVWL